MLHWSLIALLILHGLIHIMGLGKAYGNVAVLKQPVGKAEGWMWALATVLFVWSAVMRFLHHDTWWMVAAPAVILSQALILRHWREARFGTVANVLLAVAVVLGFSTWSFRNDYEHAVHSAEQEAMRVQDHRIAEADLLPLPIPVQRYLRDAGVIGTVRPQTMRITFTGELRSLDGPWMPFTSAQLNTFDPPTRTYWLDAVMKGLPTKGLHHYSDGTASMRIKLLGTVPVQELSGAVLDTTETVTWFNELCLFAPGALIDPRVTWQEMDSTRAEATFTHKGIRISAVLVFDEEGRLVDFISDDRSHLAPDGILRRERFTTPSSNHQRWNGLLLPSYGEATWKLANGDFTYGRFRLNSIAYDQQP